MTVALHGRLEGLLVFDNMDDPNAFNHSDLQRLTRLREHAMAAVTKARTLVTLQEKTPALQQQKEQVEQAYDNVELLEQDRSRHHRQALERRDHQHGVPERELADGRGGVRHWSLQRGRQPARFPGDEGERRASCRRSATGSTMSRGSLWCATRAGRRSSSRTCRASTPRYIKNYKPPVAGNPVASLLYLPLVYKDRAIGVITAQSFRTHAYTDYHLNILRNLATYATIALENADAYRQSERHARPPEVDAGTAGRAGEARVARRPDRRHRARDQEPAELREQLRGAVGGAGRGAAAGDRAGEGAAGACRLRSAAGAGRRSSDERAQDQRSRPAGRQHRARDAAAFAGPVGRTAADRRQRAARGVRQPLVPRRAGAGLLVQPHGRTRVRPLRWHRSRRCPRTSAGCSSTS